MSGPLVSARAAWGWGKGQPLLPHTPSPPLCPGHRWGPCPHSRDVGDSRPLSQGVQSQLPSLGRAQAGPLPGLPLAAAAPCQWPAQRSHTICPCPVCPSKPLLWALSLDRFVLGQRLLTRSYICACWLLARLLLAQAGNPGPQAGRQAQALTYWGLSAPRGMHRGQLPSWQGHCALSELASSSLCLLQAQTTPQP